MKAGSLRHRLIFERKTSPAAHDGYGAPQEVWATAFATWGMFEPVGGREFPLATKMTAEATARFLIRYRADIDTANYRIQFQNRAWDIVALLPVDGRNVGLYIEVREFE
jgi:SPP1 family predicted phage head-tail adaptor